MPWVGGKRMILKFQIFTSAVPINDNFLDRYNITLKFSGSLAEKKHVFRENFHFKRFLMAILNSTTRLEHSLFSHFVLSGLDPRVLSTSKAANS